MSDQLREALEMIASIADPYPARLAREALAAAPEPSYEWIAFGRDEGEPTEALCDPIGVESVARFALAMQAANPYDETWIERRVVGPWERVEVEDGEG